MKYILPLLFIICIGIVLQIHPVKVSPANAQQPTFGPTCEAGTTPGVAATTCPTNTEKPTAVPKIPVTGTGSTLVMALLSGGIFLAILGVGTVAFTVSR
ncbi:hypothetical protein HYW55_00205 [Candidatus Gottesmanbacteria bacterium]|nr:hypothetical protein [Candidatus Gottesmanbacteria bacterium]